MFIEFIGYFAAVLTTSSSLPQLIKIVETKSSDDVSTLMFSLLVAGNISWLVYAVLLKAYPILFASSFSAIINFATLYLRLKYKSNIPVKAGSEL
jgi:MtN3 and saliva related transmembrane protein